MINSGSEQNSDLLEKLSKHPQSIELVQLGVSITNIVFGTRMKVIFLDAKKYEAFDLPENFPELIADFRYRAEQLCASTIQLTDRELYMRIVRPLVLEFLKAGI